MPKKTFVYHDGALGDLLLSFPALSLIRHESSLLHLAAGKNAAVLLKAADCIDEASDAGSIFYSTLHMSYLQKSLKDLLADFDRAFIFSKKAKSTLSEQIERIIPETLVITTIPPGEIRKHIPDFRLEQLPACFSKNPPSVRLAIPCSYTEEAEKILFQNGYEPGMPLISIHPGSGGSNKNWQRERFFELVEQLSLKHSCFTAFITGPAESKSMKNEIEHFTNKNKKQSMHLKKADLITVAALLQRSSLYIGNDSGITHLASAVNNSVIALFGPTDPILWAPFNKNIKIISSERECAPCGEDRHACKNPDCLSEIPVSLVFREAVSFLDQGEY